MLNLFIYTTGISCVQKHRNTVNGFDIVLLRFRVCESEFVDLTPNKPEKVGDVPGAAAAAAAVIPAGSRKVPYTIHVSLLNNGLFRLSLTMSTYGKTFLVHLLYTAYSL